MFSKLVQEELDRARTVHATPFHSAHEGLAIIQEEFEELKQDVFKKHYSKEDFDDAVKGELVQLAAMCQRFYEDLFQKKDVGEC